MLSIGGSDPSSGAGIQGDIRVSQALCSYCFTVVTAVTSQNTDGYFGTFPLRPTVISDQIDSITSDFDIDVIKIGMLYDRGIINAVCRGLRGVDAPVIADPVMRSTTGGILMCDDALRHYRAKVVPLSHAITPNVEESCMLAGIHGGDPAMVADVLHGMGACNVVITGIDCGRRVSDHIRTPTRTATLYHPRTDMENHGGGCTFSAALALSVARGRDIISASRFAAGFTRRSITGARRIGGGVAVTHPPRSDVTISRLADGISRLLSIPSIHAVIPECQTNFVYSKPRPSTIRDIAGVAGRIVRAGTGVTVAGNLEFGGSQHVATAVLAASSRFAHIRSAANIRYNDKIMDSMRMNGFKVRCYDRSREPAEIRMQENSSVAWGVRSAIRRARIPPDAIFHTGAHGKEPMTLVFGTTPRDVSRKIRRICASLRVQPAAPEEK